MPKSSISHLIAKARHDGFLAAWQAKMNPYQKGTRLWKEFNEGRRIAASGDNYSSSYLKFSSLNNLI